MDSAYSLLDSGDDDAWEAQRKNIAKPYPGCEDDWERQRNNITELYITKGYFLRDVRRIMDEQHQFRAR